MLKFSEFLWWIVEFLVFATQPRVNRSVDFCEVPRPKFELYALSFVNLMLESWKFCSLVLLFAPLESKWICCVVSMWVEFIKFVLKPCFKGEHVKGDRKLLNNRLLGSDVVRQVFYWIFVGRVWCIFGMCARERGLRDRGWFRLWSAVWMYACVLHVTLTALLQPPNRPRRRLSVAGDRPDRLAQQQQPQQHQAIHNVPTIIIIHPFAVVSFVPVVPNRRMSVADFRPNNSNIAPIAVGSTSYASRASRSSWKM